jgi:hypothetical protein
MRGKLTLQEIRRPAPHARVNVRLGGFDVVVEVVAEGLDVRNDFFSSLFCEMSREEDCQN